MPATKGACAFLPPIGDAAIRRFLGEGLNLKLPLLSVELARALRKESESTDLVRLPVDPFDASDLTSSSALLSSVAEVSFMLE